MSQGVAVQAQSVEAPRRPLRRLGWSRRIEARVVLCLGLVALADWLFFRHSLGCNLGIYIASALGALVLTQPQVLARRAGLVLWLLVAGLAGAAVLQPTPQGLILAVAGLIAFALVGRQGWNQDVGPWVRRYVAFAFQGLFQPFRDLGIVQRWALRSGSAARTWSMLTWVLPLGLGAVFLWLFAAANPVIQTWMDQISTNLRHLLGGIDLGRIVFWGVVGVGAWALLRTRARFVGPVARRGQVRAPAEVLTPAMIVRCLWVFNALFLVQNLLDLRYLLLGAALPEGMTYAGYAHRGAYPLVATALLAAGFVLVAFRAGSGKSAGPWARRLVYLWLLQNVILTFAAATRLALYVEVYTLTRLRLAAVIWMGLVALGLILIAVRIVSDRSNRWLVRVNVFAALAVVYVFCFINTPGLIAEYNVAHCREVSGVGEPIDLDYLSALGPSALPAWQRLAATPGAGAAHDRASTTIRAINRTLNEQTSNWRGWTWRRAALLASPAPSPE